MTEIVFSPIYKLESLSNFPKALWGRYKGGIQTQVCIDFKEESLFPKFYSR